MASPPCAATTCTVRAEQGVARYPRPMGSARNDSTGNGVERVSVVLATFNGQQFLAEQLATLKNQTRAPDDLIIVDDASTDDTVAMLRAFERSAPFPVTVIAQDEHLGTCPTFEEGLRRASGDILIICDQDDRWRPEKIDVLSDRMRRHPEALLAFSDAVLIDESGRRLSRSRWRVAGFGVSQWAAMEQDPLGQMLARQVVSGCTAAIRKELLPALLPFPAGLHPAMGMMMYDRWISLIAAAAGTPVTIPERLVEYRIHAGQQIGIPALQIRRIAPQSALRLGQFVAPRIEKTGRFAYQRAHLREIDKRLTAAALDSGESRLRLQLAEDHLRSRETLELGRTQRAGSIAHEYLTADGYRRFSLGLAAALSDLVR